MTILPFCGTASKSSLSELSLSLPLPLPLSSLEELLISPTMLFNRDFSENRKGNIMSNLRLLMHHICKHVHKAYSFVHGITIHYGLHSPQLKKKKAAFFSTKFHKDRNYHVKNGLCLRNSFIKVGHPLLRFHIPHKDALYNGSKKTPTSHASFSP